jgi:hypothetical protein
MSAGEFASGIEHEARTITNTDSLDAAYELDLQMEISPLALMNAEVIEVQASTEDALYAAGAFEEDDYIQAVNSFTPEIKAASQNSDILSNQGSVSLDEYNRVSGISNDDDLLPELDDTDDTDGIGNTSKVTDAERFTSPFANTVYTNEKPPITHGHDTTYYRKYGYEYPAEAALADAYGTRMYDIRFITNTAITSRIDTSEVIGHTASGRGITEIGFSGKGRLGEVVTFADGTQRVEILFKNGNSGYYSTTGKYTIDEITDQSKYIPDLTPFERDIRYYAKETSASNQAMLDSFLQYIKMNGIMTE